MNTIAIDRYYSLVKEMNENSCFLEFIGTDEDGNAIIAAKLKKDDGTLFVRPYTIKKREI